MKTDAPSLSPNYLPTGRSELWHSDFLWLNVISDGVIALALITLSVCLYLIQHQKPDSPYRPLIIMCTTIFIAIGVTHLLEIWTVWHGEYAVVGFSKSVTALLAMGTAIIVVISLRQLPALRSPEELQKLNVVLQKRIEEQESVREKLTQTEKRLRTFLKQAPDAMLIILPSGKIEYSNDAMNTLFGYPHGGLDDKSILEIVAPQSRHKIGSGRNDLYATDGSLWGTSKGEFTAIRKDDTQFPAELRVNAISTDGEGDVTLATYRDLSEHKAREARTHKSLTELAHASRMSTVGQMAASLAHELNQPLTAISVNLHTAMSMQKKLANPDLVLLEMIEENYQSALHAGQIIKSLRQLVRKDDGGQCPTDINRLVTTTTDLIRPEAKASGVKLNLELQTALPEAIADPVQVQQVIVNLGRNAIQACSDLGETEKIISISTSLQADSTIMVKVSDNGPGLDPAVKAELFSPNITTKENGMGLGLSICLSIIEAHGGRLWHVDDQRQGAAFCFTLRSKLNAKN